MMSRGKITPGSLSYYTDVVATGIEDYYAGRGEAPGFWIGTGAAAAGIEGEVSAAQLAALFDMRHPVSGERLGDDYVVPASRDRVYGWDLTCSAPKSVSSLWAVGGGGVGMEVRDAHDVAVQAGMTYLEEHAAFGRQGKAGIRQVDTDGLVAAAFVHRVSRNGDPQLHTHLLVSNRVRCADGVWRALDSKALHPQIKPAGMIYQAALRAELTARLGVRWGPVSEDGQAEIQGVPEKLQKQWSSRRRDIEAAGRTLIAEQEAKLERRLTPAERRVWFERAALNTRSAKDHDGVSDAGLHDQWSRDAESLGYPAVSWIPDTVDRARERVVEVTSEMAAMHAVAELEQDVSAWTRAELVKRISRLTPASVGDATAAREWVEHTTDLALELQGVVSLDAPEPAPPASLRRRDGRSVYDAHNATKYTTTRTLEVEQRILDAVTAGRDAHRAVAAGSHVRTPSTHSGSTTTKPPR